MKQAIFIRDEARTRTDNTSNNGNNNNNKPRMAEYPSTGSLARLCTLASAVSGTSPTSASASAASVVSAAAAISNTAKHRDPFSSQPTSASSSPSGRSAGGVVAAPQGGRCLLAQSVIPYLDESAIVAVMRTCRRAREIMTSDDVWETRLKDLRVNLILVNRTCNFFRAFRSDIITLRGLEGYYDFESEDVEPERGSSSSSPVSAVKRVVLTVSPAFLGFVTPVARVMLVVEYFGVGQEDVFEGTMRYSFPRRTFVMSTFLTRCPRQEGPRFDVVVARSVRKWGTQKPAHFEAVRGGTRLIISISVSAPSPANGYLPSNELLTVSRVPREGEGVAPSLPAEPTSTSNPAMSSASTTSSATATPTMAANTSPPTSERKFSLRSLLGR